ncbi:hypothetical protein L1987_58367 [Smallanthus sonchifolius]|uniref:Uncharacterized protein n=1 Tax=Smallanthus sonchifolius TaxID=185202 RepID=A0ACB9DG42_9ASTR|nr:hypothetical protein L1987_58367 [Smallanthus sonchifolius]
MTELYLYQENTEEHNLATSGVTGHISKLIQELTELYLDQGNTEEHNLATSGVTRHISSERKDLEKSGRVVVWQKYHARILSIRALISSLKI